MKHVMAKRKQRSSHVPKGLFHRPDGELKNATRRRPVPNA